MAVVALVVGVLSLVASALPASALLSGVDVASFQHPGGASIDWAAVKASGQSFAFIKATEGTGYTNPYFASDWSGSGAAGLYRGAYHFARPALPLSTAVDQARYFVSRTGSMTGAADIGGVLDLETTGGLGQADLANWTRTWLAEVQRLTGKAPMIYTGYYFWQDSLGNPADIGARYRLWLPSYPANPESTTFRPLVPAGWNNWTFWQYRSDGSVPGISGEVDMNRFCCDLGSLAALGGGGANAGSPFGTFDLAVGGAGSVTVGGWAMDPDSTGPIQVHVYAGSVGTALVANGSRPDVGTAFPGFGNDHGYVASVPANPGMQQVCAYGINTGGGQNVSLGCRTVYVLPHNPIGNLDVASPVIGGIDVGGWAFDPDTAASIPVHVYIDGTGYALNATGDRSDIGSIFPAYGPKHGFSARLPASPGTHTVCAYGIDTAAPGSNAGLGCRTVRVPTGSPTGSLDVAYSAFGLIRVAGWALDPDTAASTQVHVYVNNVGTAINANLSRPDIAAVFPGAGDLHGFDAVVRRVGTGPNTVCAYAIDIVAPGNNVSLGCRTL